MMGGASGFIPVIGHVAAKEYREMIDPLDKGKVWEARELSHSLRPLVTAIMGNGQDTVMTGYTLHPQGIIDTPKLRLPPVEARVKEVEDLWLALKIAGPL